jgi:hypothetical protein
MMVKNSEFDYWYKEEFFSGELSRQAVIMEDKKVAIYVTS